MKIKIELTFTIDESAWAADYGLDTTDVSGDITTSFENALSPDGGLVEAVKAWWPVMKDYGVEARLLKK